MCRTRCLQSTYSPPVGSIYAPKGLQIQNSSGFYSEYFDKFLRKKNNENLKHMKHESWFRTYRVNKMTHKIFSNLRKHSEVSQFIVWHCVSTQQRLTVTMFSVEEKQRETRHSLADFCVSRMIWTACTLTWTLVRGQQQASVVLLLDMNPSLWNSRLIMQTRKYLQNLHWRRIKVFGMYSPVQLHKGKINYHPIITYFYAVLS